MAFRTLAALAAALILGCVTSATAQGADPSFFLVKVAERDLSREDGATNRLDLVVVGPVGDMADSGIVGSLPGEGDDPFEDVLIDLCDEEGRDETESEDTCVANMLDSLQDDFNIRGGPEDPDEGGFLGPQGGDTGLPGDTGDP